MTIIAAVDQSDHSKTVASEAAALADAFDDQLELVHVLDRSAFVELERTRVDKSGDVADLDQVRFVAKSIADEAGTAVDGRYEAVGLFGTPADRIVEYADEIDARYVVVGPRKRSPTGKLLFGSVAQSVLLNAPCPVLTVRQQ